MVPRYLLLLVFYCLTFSAFAQDAKALIRLCNRNLANVKSYTCKAHFNFEIPGLNIQEIDGQVFYKKPNKFRIKTKGIVFMPKQNPNLMLAILADTVSFMPVYAGQDQGLSKVQLVPLAENDIAIAKFLIDERGKIMKAEITSKENGTVQISNRYADPKVPLPSQSLISFDLKKFKVPKMISVELNAKTMAKSDKDRTKGSINIQYTSYVLNKYIEDAVFVEEK
jgi:hypothetical protein